MTFLDLYILNDGGTDLRHRCWEAGKLQEHIQVSGDKIHYLESKFTSGTIHEYCDPHFQMLG